MTISIGFFLLKRSGDHSEDKIAHFEFKNSNFQYPTQYCFAKVNIFRRILAYYSL